jgi:DNA mismatch repair ATPase MutS
MSCANYYSSTLRQIGDLERLISKDRPAKRANPREVCQLKKALKAIGEYKEAISRGLGKCAVTGYRESQLNPCHASSSDKDRKGTAARAAGYAGKRFGNVLTE